MPNFESCPCGCPACKDNECESGCNGCASNLLCRDPECIAKAAPPADMTRLFRAVSYVPPECRTFADQAEAVAFLHARDGGYAEHYNDAQKRWHLVASIPLTLGGEDYLTA
jgi:hypothetical protein